MFQDDMTQTLAPPTSACLSLTVLDRRLLSSMKYVPIPSEGELKLEGMDISANDMRCFLKDAVLKLSLAFFESVFDPEVSLMLSETW